VTTRELRDADDGSEIYLASGDELRVVLQEKPTTGYLWSMLRDGSPVLLFEGEQKGTASAGPQLGGSRVRVLLFRATSPGRTQVQFVHGRAWSSGQSADRTCTFSIVVGS
jgi:predicted secreted protein